MKNKKLLALVAALLCLSMLLMACNKEETPAPEPSAPDASTPETPAPEPDEPHLLDGLYNNDWTFTPGKLSAITKIEAITNDILACKNSLVIFRVSDEVVKAYNVNTNKTVLTLTDTTDKQGSKTVSIKHYPILIAADTVDVSGILVLTVTTDSTMNSSTMSIQPFANTSVSKQASLQIDLYDEAGNAVLTVDNKTIAKGISEKSNFQNYMNSSFDAIEDTDLYYFERSVYRFREDGTITFIKNYDIQTMPDLDMQMGEYYYTINDSSYDAIEFAIYDNQLNRVAYHTVSTTYGMGDPEFSILNNGSILVQATEILPSDAIEYDVYYVNTGSSSAGTTIKFNLNTQIIGIDGSVTSIDADYFLYECIPMSMMLSYSQYENYLDASLENVGMIFRIENKQFKMSYDALEFVSLSNDGTILQSFKVRKDMEFSYTYMGNGIYSITTVLDEVLIVDRDGNVLFSYDEDLSAKWIDSRYMFCSSGIYDTNGNKIYDFDEHNVTDYDVFNYSAILKAKNEDDSITYFLFKDGTATAIGTVGGTNATIADFDCDTDTYYYYTKDLLTGKYTYYNEVGTEIGTFDQELNYECSYENGFIYYDSTNNNYYQFSYDGYLYRT